MGGETSDENRIRNLLQRLSLAVQGAGYGVWELDLVTHNLMWDSKMSAIYGFTLETFNGDVEQWKSCVHPDDTGLVDDRFVALYRGEVVENLVFRIFRKDNRKLCFIEANGFLERDSSGEPTRLVGMNRDITARVVAENEQKKSEAIFRRIIERFPVPVAVNSGLDEITYVNPSFTRTFGYTLDDVPTLNDWWEHAYPDSEYRESVARTWGERLEQSRKTSDHFVPLEVDIRCKNGTVRSVVTSGTPLGDAPEDPCLAVLIDISERKRSELELQSVKERLSKVINVADGVLWQANAETLSFTYVSGGAERLLGYPMRQWIEENGFWANHLHPDDREPIVKFCIEATARKESHDFEYRMIAADGRVVWVRDMVSVIAVEGRPTELIGLIVDITRSKEMETNLKVAQLRAEDASKSKSEFLANMSHEIRTPLNGLLGMTNLLLESPLSPEQRDYAQAARLSGESLMVIVDDILDFSRIEAGQLKIVSKAFGLSQLIRHLNGILKDRAAPAGITLSWDIAADIPNALVGDEIRMAQVLLNLIGNAIKFSPTGTSVSIDASVYRTTTSEVTLLFKVSDRGIGISPEKLTWIFEPFRQADQSTTRSFGGAGLGLSISKKLVGLMGGEISVASEEGAGSCFSFTILLGLAGLSSSAEIDRPVLANESVDQAHILRSVRVLLVEDNSINQRVATVMLEKSGCHVTVVSDGEEALEALERTNREFDAVLMDCQMPRMSGYEATKKIRECEQGTGLRLPIIAMTAHAMSGERERCLEAGMDDYLSKPIDRGALVEIVRRWTTGR